MKKKTYVAWEDNVSSSSSLSSSSGEKTNLCLLAHQNIEVNCVNDSNSSFYNIFFDIIYSLCMSNLIQKKF